MNRSRPRPATRARGRVAFDLLDAALDVAHGLQVVAEHGAIRWPEPRSQSAASAATRSSTLVDRVCGRVRAPARSRRGEQPVEQTPRTGFHRRRARGPRNEIVVAMALVVLAFPHARADLPGLLRGDRDRRQRRVSTE